MQQCVCLQIIEATQATVRGIVKRKKSSAFPAIWNELKPYTAKVAWHGKKRMERQTEREWKAVGRCNVFQT